MNYIKTIYGNRKETEYPKKLVRYLINKYMSTKQSEYTTLLDIGAGTELYLKLFFQHGLLTYGIDLQNNIQSTIFSKINILPCDLEVDSIPFKDNIFNYIFCKSTIEHVQNTNNLLSQSWRVLKPNGKIIILTPSWEYNYKWFYDDPTHIKPFCRKGLQDALRINKFKNIKVEYFYHLPYTWNNIYGKYFAKLIALLPDYLRWKDKEETIARIWIRFAKEVQLLTVAEKY